ncbi:MAG: trehalose-6-phosphate synthase [Actinobacteria bacterium]|nr:trehalose-6-phosphate synthase [Actinomycetota bacterium]
MIESELKIGVLSRRAPIGNAADLTATLEHVGGLTRVLPALAEFANIDWTALTTQSQVGLPRYYSFSEISNQVYQHDINIFLAEIDSKELDLSDWFCAHYIWPLLHGLPIPELADAELSERLNAVRSTSQALAAESVDVDNHGYLVNDFQLSQVPVALRELEPSKQISFFLHTPWPKSVPSSNIATNILEFLASGMLAADVIQFQTQKDLRAFENFVITHLPLELEDVKLEVNPVSVNVQQLNLQSLNTEDLLNLREDEISYVHIARSDPIKNTLASINAFTELARDFKDSAPRSYLDLYIVPSRQQWPMYQVLLSEIVKTVEQCNSKLSSLNYAPIRLHIGNDYQRASQALTRYNFLIACSVADGLNLVVKEGAILNDRNGAIVSTKNVGAIAELGNFCIVAKEATAIGIIESLREARNLSSESRRNMSAELKRHIQEFDSSNWAQNAVANFKVLEKV